jgi:hypothetical protein
LTYALFPYILYFVNLLSCKISISLTVLIIEALLSGMATFKEGIGMFAKKKALFILCAMVIALPLCAYLGSGRALWGGGEDFEFKWVLPPAYNMVRGFSEGRLWAQREENGPWAMFDESGDMLKEGVEASVIWEYHDGVARFQTRKKTSPMRVFWTCRATSPFR